MHFTGLNESFTPTQPIKILQHGKGYQFPEKIDFKIETFFVMGFGAFIIIIKVFYSAVLHWSLYNVDRIYHYTNSNRLQYYHNTTIKVFGHKYHIIWFCSTTCIYVVLLRRLQNIKKSVVHHDNVKIVLLYQVPMAHPYDGLIDQPFSCKSSTEGDKLILVYFCTLNIKDAITYQYN